MTLDLESAIKHCEEVAERQERTSSFWQKGSKAYKNCLECAKEHRQLATWLRELKQLREHMSHSEEPNKWIPFIKRPMTEEEREEYEERTGIEETMIFNCPLPEDGEQVFVSYGDYVTIGTFYEDNGGVCYFDIGDIYKADAWMPLPLPYKAERDDESCDEIWEKAYKEREGKK